MPQVIVVGEALVEIMRSDKGFPLDQAGSFLGPYASGAPAIFAVAAARLGLQVGFAGAVGADGFGRLLANRLQAENVDTRYLQKIQDYTTGIAFIAYAAEGSREFVFHLRQSASAVFTGEHLHPDYFRDVSWLHISGSALFLSESSRRACEKALEMTRAAGGKLSLDPNLRPELMPVAEAREVLQPFIETADLLLPTVEEAHTLAGSEEDDEAAQALVKRRNCIVALKRGSEGASIFSGGSRIDIPGYSVAEVDPTGAGDSFNAGFVYGLESGWPIEQAGAFANASGALAVTCQGPMEGAPTEHQVMTLLNRP